MDNYSEFIIYLLRSSNSVEFFIAGLLLYRLRKYVIGTPVFNVIKNIGISLMTLGGVREIASSYDYLVSDNTGHYTLMVNTIVYAYIIYVLIKVSQVASRTEFSSIKFNDVIDKMIHDLNLSIEKAEKKSN